MKKIILKNLSVSYDVDPVIWNVDLDIFSNKMTAIVGPNGAGKSTLFKAILGLVKPLTGKIEIINNDNLFSYVPQNNSIDWDFPATVFDVVLMGRYHKIGWFKRPTKEDKEIAMSAIEKVKLEEFKDRQINDLSGGQKQRVFLARALAQQTDLYLLDEPFQGVDAYSEKMIVSILKDLVAEEKTIVVVHHDLQTIEDYFDDVVLINQNIIAYGPVKDVFTENNIKETYKQRLPYSLQKEID
ncbi:metal ABC transporter ATP-binding protein [Gemelliphila palaticanis]|uniref:Metal ABC transporter ATP-binding protein n=1 Tax=Gemelliphila palaticanis TaxID=81950 RepID=A0ABX2T199_9BACL|nr:metal ABC transporter ATP-binding protein [Gemella palaticanis]MBF0715482.1 metal ABC transporter ATP-binding protein [Gemella palaticanis]NYS47412.1 metal ABC transporter ATP-binding protein [Gemella palaticanis]